MTLKLSDAFRHAGIAGSERKEGREGREEQAALELTVRVLNVNEGHNEEILGKCEVLHCYAIFIGKIREYQRVGRTLEDAIAAAVDYCIANGILVEYLKSNGSEVRNMLFTEFNLEDAKQVWREEGREEREFEIVQNAWSMNMPIGDIVKLTGLTPDEIESQRPKL